MWCKRVAVALSALSLSGVAMAQDEGKVDDNAAAKTETATPEPLHVERDGSLELRGETLDYRTVASETYLKDDKGEPRAAIFSVAYIAEGTEDPAKRPVAFIFNGGPGSSSVWLHMGAFGPMRVDWPYGINDDGAPPYGLVPNDGSLLDVADMVFIDPVGTGYSRALGETEPKEFFGIDKDADSIAEFIRIWLTENKRWASPRYLVGESYGTTRAAALAAKLQDRYDDVTLNGVILISAVLDFDLAGGKMSGVGLLPTQAAIAWYHDKVDKSEWDGDFEAFIDEARDFAANRYAPVVLLGQKADKKVIEAVRTEMSRFTGLSTDYLSRARLNVGVQPFMKELRRDEGLVVGRLDGRFTGKDANDLEATPEADPSFYAFDGVYTSLVNDYFSRILDLGMDRQYKILPFDVSPNWNYDGDENELWTPRPNVATGLGRAMRQNSDMKVLFATGYYDQATPFFAAEMSLAEAGIPQDRIVSHYYKGGHMMYLEKDKLLDLADDIRDFIGPGQE